LRSADEPGGVAPPLPSAEEIASLVEYARAAGLAVELRTRGDISRIPSTVGVAVYRIAQESLANAARHAPRARTVLDLELADGQVRLVAETSGPAAAQAKESPNDRATVSSGCGSGSSLSVANLPPDRRPTVGA
jgi:signal transduction histidine kinase